MGKTGHIKKCLERDSGKCQKCGKNNVLLDVHHKIPYRCFINRKDAHHIDNLITLCRKCHFIEEAKKNLINIRIGKECKIWNYTNLYGCELGNNVSVGSFTEIGPNVIIGDNVTIGAHSFIPEGFTIEENVFLGPNFLGINDRYPPSPKDKWEKTVIKKGARIGASVTVMCGITIGEGAIVGAGSLVIKDVMPNVVVIGNRTRNETLRKFV